MLGDQFLPIGVVSSRDIRMLPRGSRREKGGEGGRDLLQVRRRRGVLAELHAELSLALGGSPQLGGEAEHGVQTNIGDQGEVIGTDLRVDDGGVALVHQHQSVTLELVGGRDGRLHQGLEHGATGLVEDLSEGHLGSLGEGKIGRIGHVGGTVVDHHLGADDLVSQEGTLLAAKLETLTTGRDELVRNDTTHDLVLKGIGLRVSVGLDPATNPGVVTGAAGLPLEQVVKVGAPRDGLTVGHTRLARDAVDLVLTAEALDVDLEVELAHARDDGLLTLLVHEETEGGVLALEAVHGLGEVVGVGGLLGLDGQRHDSVRHEHGRHGVGQVAVGEGVAGGAVDAKHGADLTGANLVDILHLVGVHAHDTGDADLLVGARVEEVGALPQGALVDADVGELAVVVLLELEGEADERQRVVGHQPGLSLTLRPVQGQVLDVGRVGEVVADGVEHGLDGLVGQGGTHQHGAELERDGRPPDGGLDLLGRRGLLVQEHLSDLVIHVGQLLDELLALLLDELLQVVRDRVLDADVHAAGTLGVDGLHVDQVDDALALVLQADGHLDGGGGDLQLGVDLLDGLPGVGTHAVHLVDEADAGDVVAPHLTVDRDGLGLDTADGAENHDGAVEHAHGALDLNGEVDVTGRVDQVNVVRLLLAVLDLLPVGEGSGRLDGDTLLPLEVHRVHLGADALLASHLVDGLDAARVEEDTLGDGGLAAVDVGGDTNVPHARQAVLLVRGHLLVHGFGGQVGGLVGGLPQTVAGARAVSAGAIAEICQDAGAGDNLRGGRGSGGIGDGSPPRPRHVEVSTALDLDGRLPPLHPGLLARDGLGADAHEAAGASRREQTAVAQDGHGPVCLHLVARGVCGRECGGRETSTVSQHEKGGRNGWERRLGLRRELAAARPGLPQKELNFLRVYQLGCSIQNAVAPLAAELQGPEALQTGSQLWGH